MTGTARGPEKRSRRAGVRPSEEHGTMLGGIGVGLAGGGAQARPDADFGRAQAMLRLKVPRTAAEIKELYRELSDFTDDELKRIPILAEETHLEQGATYLDLQDADRQPFTASGSMRVGRDNWIVPKSQVDYELWNRLRRVEH